MLLKGILQYLEEFKTRLAEDSLEFAVIIHWHPERVKTNLEISKIIE